MSDVILKGEEEENGNVSFNGVVCPHLLAKKRIEVSFFLLGAL
jgi:hypothetical protein